VLLVFCAMACERDGGRTVTVEFRSAQGIQGGRPVYFAGVEIGKTGSPTIISGKAHVPVYLFRSQRNAVAPGSVFLIADDPNDHGASCLVGHALNYPTPTVAGSPEVYQGVSSQLELAVLIGADRAKEFWEKLKQ